VFDWNGRQVRNEAGAGSVSTAIGQTLATFDDYGYEFLRVVIDPDHPDYIASANGLYTGFMTFGIRLNQ
jgi:hypothetical protein